MAISEAIERAPKPRAFSVAAPRETTKEITMRLLRTALLAGALMAPASFALAQDASEDPSSHGMAAIGAGAIPDYDGAGDVRVLPFALADAHFAGLNVQLRGQALRVDLAPDRRFAIGPAIGARLPRDNADGPAGLLPELDLAVEAGAFIGYRLGGDRTGQGALHTELTVVQDVSGVHDGLLATASASYALLRQRDMFLSLETQATWANADYTRAYFGVDDAGSLASGLDVYRPDSGVRDVGAGLTAGYWFSPSFGVIGRAGAAYLVGDPADSPITDEGSRWQPFGGLALSYRY